MKKLEIGEYVYVDGGYAPDAGTVVKIEPPGVYTVNTNGWGPLQFDSDGYECNPDGTPAEGQYIPQCSLPFKLRLSLRGEKIEF
jgi:hypothetical protein